ncbi:aminopeptidase P family protein [Leptolyngbya sp. FACHB-36]|uniref:M24 family metallopeptidase n=1 Tax=Leptolyngbya sp. FACHB-36 TaxID=2692808 RepID=UPI00167FF23D|nr:M24 family metallopeptidase [Leptolyngbya sp. FACHB-36]MBD2020224.1 aminopeptidase P family protein [Leptolyngbya sp. FACHB-36]
MNEIEKRKNDFSNEAFFTARTKTWEAIQKISEQISVGMLEQEANEIAKSTLHEMGTRQGWHKPYVHFGCNTVKTLFDTPEPNVRLEEDDIYFIDIAPVWQGYEGDAGNTFVTGTDAEMLRCSTDVRRVFEQVAEKWKVDELTGNELYQFAEQTAQELGWLLNLSMNGHRLADFPHTAYHSGKLAETSFCPSPNLWVLEIQIKHPQKPFGAFFEDLLA